MYIYKDRKRDMYIHHFRSKIFIYFLLHEYLVPLSTGEWLLSFWQAHLKAKKNVDIKSRPFECIVEEGEMIFVPHG
jgi:hypothetical protein